MAANRGEVLTLIFPEVDLNQWIWVVSFLQGVLWVLLQHILDLLGPVVDSVLQKCGLILAGCFLTGGDIVGWQRQKCSAFDLTDGDVGVGQEDVESIHQILGHKVGPSNHVKWVSENWHVDSATHSVDIGKDFLGDFHEHDLLGNVGIIKFSSTLNLFLGSGSDDQDALLLNGSWAWCFRLESDHVSASWHSEDEHIVLTFTQEFLHAGPKACKKS